MTSRRSGFRQPSFCPHDSAPVCSPRPFRRGSKRSFVLLAPLALVLATKTARAEILFTFTDLGTLGGFYSEPSGINENGQVVGTSETAASEQRGFHWTSTGGIQSVGTLGGGWSEARGINDSAQIVGFSQNSSGEDRAFLWQSDSMTSLGTLGGSWSEARAINNLGQVVGTSERSDFESHAFLYQLGTMTDLGTLGGDWSEARDINQTGQVAGYSVNANGDNRAFRWTPTTDNATTGTLQALAGLPDTWSEASGINDAGQVVGFYTTGGADHGFFWDSGTYQDLGTLGGTWSYAYGIDSTGRVVGSAANAAGNPRAFLWDATGGLQDLNNLVSSPGWQLEDAFAINDHGQIVGVAYNGTDYHGYLLTVVPEPSSLLALLAAAGVLGLVALCRSSK